MLKISGVYLIGNPEICQDPPAVGKMIRPFYKNELRLEFPWYILICRKCPHKTLFQNTVGRGVFLVILAIKSHTYMNLSDIIHKKNRFRKTFFVMYSFILRITSIFEALSILKYFLVFYNQITYCCKGHFCKTPANPSLALLCFSSKFCGIYLQLASKTAITMTGVLKSVK